MAQPPPQDSEQAGAPRQVEEDDRVGGGQATVERREPHRVENPRVAHEHPRLEPGPPLATRPLAAAAAEEVAVDNLDAEPRSERPRQRRLARTAAADHRDPAQVCAHAVAAASSRGRRRERICETPSRIVTP
jgi:hypothetical protein